MGRTARIKRHILHQCERGAGRLRALTREDKLQHGNKITRCQHLIVLEGEAPSEQRICDPDGTRRHDASGLITLSPAAMAPPRTQMLSEKPLSITALPLHRSGGLPDVSFECYSAAALRAACSARSLVCSRFKLQTKPLLVLAS